MPLQSRYHIILAQRLADIEVDYFVYANALFNART